MKPFRILPGLGQLLWLAALLPAAAATPAKPGKPVPTHYVEVLRTYPHDVNAYTQGLFYKDGFIYESTGLLNRSSVRRVRLETGEVVQKRDLAAGYFGEGITWWGKQLIELTWQSEVGFVYNLETFAPEKRFSYPGEGWGLTRNDEEIIMSDGTAHLRFLNPKTLRETRRMQVTANGVALDKLNELEWVEGEIYANIWQTDKIARIDPKTGAVIGWVDLKGILPAKDYIDGHTDVLNGIAYDAKQRRLFVTGKHWPKLFEIRIVK
jgi:glutaminyl-peptide cyclotransferase